jgi:FMN-dependent oxidoreductase (nitrilotriacetate monooxygenase family)
MAAVTKHLGFGITASTSFEHPYSFARRMSTLDHLTKGRVGWNVVTGYLESAARNHGLNTITPHADRYDIADEYTEVLYKLWEGSWEDDAVGTDPGRAHYADPAKVHPIEHEGQHFRVPGIHLCEPSLQRTPVLYQAGSSARGSRFAATHAECVFLNGQSQPGVKKIVEGIRSQAVEQGRASDDIQVFLGATIVTGRTDQEAQARYDDLRRYTDPEGALALWSGWLGTDLSRFDLDDPVAVTDNRFLKSSVAMFGQGQWTLRDRRCARDRRGGWLHRRVADSGGRRPAGVGRGDRRGRLQPHQRDHPWLVRRLHRPRGARTATARGVQDVLRRRHPAPQAVWTRPTPTKPTARRAAAVSQRR